jgi:hypothetical protein
LLADAFEKGYDGVVSFIAKTKLVDHYKTSLGATIFHGDQMFIDRYTSST